jgi:hypothetical protein
MLKCCKTQQQKAEQKDDQPKDQEAQPQKTSDTTATISEGIRQTNKEQRCEAEGTRSR